MFEDFLILDCTLCYIDYFIWQYYLLVFYSIIIYLCIVSYAYFVILVMRLGKKKEKEKDSDGRSQVVEGVSRLICSVKTSHSAPMRGMFSQIFNYKMNGYVQLSQ